MIKQTIQLFVKALAIGVLLNIGFGFVPPTVDSASTIDSHGQPEVVHRATD